MAMLVITRGYHLYTVECFDYTMVFSSYTTGYTSEVIPPWFILDTCQRPWGLGVLFTNQLRKTPLRYPQIWEILPLKCAPKLLKKHQTISTVDVPRHVLILSHEYNLGYVYRYFFICPSTVRSSNMETAPGWNLPHLVPWFSQRRKPPISWISQLATFDVTGGYHLLKKKKHILVGGWPAPLKNINQLGLWFPIYGNIKNVPNHQPAFILSESYPSYGYLTMKSPIILGYPT